MTPEAIGKLELVWSRGGSDSNACDFAGVGKDALYDYQKKYPDFADRKRQLKSQLTIKSLDNIGGQINRGDIELSKWWLERKEKAEFSARQEHAGVPEAPLGNPDIAMAASRIAGMSEEKLEERLARLKNTKK